MTGTSGPLVELSGVSKHYGALRPLRIEQLAIDVADQVALIGLDQAAAEVLISLMTGAALPDAGQVRILGQPTSAIIDSAEWLLLLDKFGIVSERAVLLEPMTVLQNIAVPFSLDIEPPSAEVTKQATAIALEAGLSEQVMGTRVGELDPLSRMRVRLGRALAFNPAVLLLEHPSATLPRADVVAFACDVRNIVERRRVATLTITADAELAGAIAERPLLLEPATGRLRRP